MGVPQSRGKDGKLQAWESGERVTLLEPRGFGSEKRVWDMLVVRATYPSQEDEVVKGESQE